MEFQGWTRYFVSWVQVAPDMYITTLEGLADGRLLSDQPYNWNECYAVEGTVLVNPDIVLSWNFANSFSEIKVKPYVPPFIPNGQRFLNYCNDITNFRQTKVALIVLAKFAAYIEATGFAGGAGYQLDNIRDALIAMKEAQDLENNPTP